MVRRFIKWLSFNIRYLWEPPWDTGTTPPEVIDFIKNVKPGRALDLGAGTGTNIITLAEAGWEALGVEYALIAVITARLKIKRAGVNARIFLRDVTDLDFLTGKFDLVLDIGCYHSLEGEERDQYRENLAGLLRPGGTFLIYGFLSEESGNPFGISKEDIEDLSRILEKFDAKVGTEREMRGSIWLNFRKKFE